MSKNGKTQMETTPASQMTIDNDSSMSAVNAEALAKLSTMHKLDMKEVESDLWKPENKDEQLVGIYIGKTLSNFIDKKSGEVVPFIEILCKSDIDGTPMVKRILEKATLKRIFDVLKLNTAIKIVYEGSQPSREGNPTQLYSVFREFTKM